MQSVNDLHQKRLSNIVSIALSLDSLSDIEVILENIARAVEADGCILWESESFANLESESSGNLYLSAKWFSEVKMPLHKIPINDSAAGYALINGDSIKDIDNFREHPLTYKEHKYTMEEANLTSMYIVPFCFGNDEKKNAALSFYRRFKVNPFDLEEREFMEIIAQILPKLYQAVCDKVGKNLLSDINLNLDNIEKKAKKTDGSDLTIDEKISNIKKSFNDICKIIADAFQCVETSIFFENRLESENAFQLFGTHYTDWTLKKDIYYPQKNEGLTAWALAEKKPIRIFNLSTFNKYITEIRREYPGVQWNDSQNFNSDIFKEKIRKILGLDEESELPPLSFMAVPIMKNKKLLGVIRCCAAKTAPWFFLRQHQEILDFITIPISRFWDDVLTHIEEEKKTASWQKLVEEINLQNDRVQKQIDDRFDFNKKQLYIDILRLTKKTIGNADILDIRLFDETTKELYFPEGGTNGRAWNKGQKKEVEDRKNRRFRDDGRKRILGFEVLNSGDVANILNVEDDPNYYSETFPETKRIIVAPIGVEDKNIGVLDVRGTGNNPFPSNAPIMAELIGRQLGLYLSLWEMEKQQRRVFEDTWHQLKSPIRQTSARVTHLLNKNYLIEPFSIEHKSARELFLKLQNESAFTELKNEITVEFQMLKGIAGKANKVLLNAGIFAEIASNGFLKEPKDLGRLTYDYTVKKLIEACRDARLMLEVDRNINFFVNSSPFYILDKIVVKANLDYLQQAINGLVDNAGKYSYANTTVNIYGGEETIENKKYFFIAVENRGIAIKPEEVEKLIRRKYRGKLAELFSGEGSGIGLWVTDHIMRAHHGNDQSHLGKLVITPTSLTGWTTAKLLFPILN